MQVQKFDLNLVPGGVPVYVFADQYDVARAFRATVYDGDELYVFDGTETITICGTKSSGTGFSYDDICSAPAGGSTVTFGLTSQMSVCAGDCICGIILSKDGIVIGTANFIIQFQRNALQEETVIDSDDFASILTEAVTEWLNDSATAQAVIAQAVDAYLEEHGGNVPETFWAIYNSTTSAEIEEAYQSGKLVLLKIAATNRVGWMTRRYTATSHWFTCPIATNTRGSTGMYVETYTYSCTNSTWQSFHYELAPLDTIADVFTIAQAYAIGDYVIYEGELYRWTSAHVIGAAWNATKVVKVLLADEVAALRSSGGGGGGAVDSVNGKTGVVVLDADDVGALPDTTTAADLGAISAPSSPATGAFLVWNGSAWVAQTLSTWQGGSY